VRIALQKQREMKMAKLQAAEPPKPKEITVIAGEFQLFSSSLYFKFLVGF